MRSVLPLALLLAACAPPQTSEAQLPAASSRDVWVLVVHGSGDGPARWATGMVEALRSRVVQPERVEFLAYDWEAAAVDKLSAAENGQREGRAIAAVVGDRGLNHVHVIAHSAAHTFDVTAAKPAGAQWAGKEGHWWPTAAYLELEPGFSLSLEASGTFDVVALRERWPAGVSEH